MGESLKLIICSFGSSLGLGILFQVRKEHLIYAGLGGALTRFIYLLLLQFTAESFIYNFFAAMAAALFAEFLAVYTKNPSTVFLYPSIIPLIPGKSLYYSVIGLILQDSTMVGENLMSCIHSLAGLGVGFVIISIFMHYQRIYRRIQKMKKQGTI